MTKRYDNVPNIDKEFKKLVNNIFVLLTAFLAFEYTSFSFCFKTCFV